MRVMQVDPLRLVHLGVHIDHNPDQLAWRDLDADSGVPLGVDHQRDQRTARAFGESLLLGDVLMGDHRLHQLGDRCLGHPDRTRGITARYWSTGEDGGEQRGQASLSRRPLLRHLQHAPAPRFRRHILVPNLVRSAPVADGYAGRMLLLCGGARIGKHGRGGAMDLRSGSPEYPQVISRCQVNGRNGLQCPSVETTIGLFKTELINERGRGAPGTRSNWPPSNTSTGTTTADRTAPTYPSPTGTSRSC